MDETSPRKRGGQVKPAAERKRNNLTFRARDDLKRRLEESSQVYRRSVSEEIEFRLEASLAEKNHLVEQWGEDIYRLADAMARALYMAERSSGASWANDNDVFDDLMESVPHIAQNLRSHINGIIPPRPELSRKDYAEQTRAERAGTLAAFASVTPPMKPRPAPDYEAERAARAEGAKIKAKWEAVISKGNAERAEQAKTADAVAPARKPKS